jgi:hypothetical protein
MKLYRQDVRICGTVYIKAKSRAEAISKVKALAGKGIDTENNAGADIPVSAARCNDPGLPEISLSPAMTFKGIEPGCGIEIVEEVAPQ